MGILPELQEQMEQTLKRLDDNVEKAKALKLRTDQLLADVHKILEQAEILVVTDKQPQIKS